MKRGENQVSPFLLEIQEWKVNAIYIYRTRHYGRASECRDAVGPEAVSGSWGPVFRNSPPPWVSRLERFALPLFF
jgi:hypothetical protein